MLIAREMGPLRSGVEQAGQIGQLLEGQAGQFLTAASAMAAASAHALKRGKITAVSSTPVMKENSMDIRHRCNVRWR